MQKDTDAILNKHIDFLTEALPKVLLIFIAKATDNDKQVQRVTQCKCLFRKLEELTA